MQKDLRTKMSQELGELEAEVKNFGAFLELSATKMNRYNWIVANYSIPRR